MFVLIDINNRLAYHSKTLAGLTDITRRTTVTMRTWLNCPQTAINKGFWLLRSEQRLSKQGGKR